MSFMRRSASSAAALIAARPSPYHASVMLYEPNPSANGTSSESPRRSKRLKLEEHVDNLPDIEDAISSNNSGSKTQADVVATPVKRRKATSSASPSPKKGKPVRVALDTPHPTPQRWEETYKSIKKMRDNIVAPVDTMGCDQLGLSEMDPKNRRITTLISLMLSSQTKDEVTSAAIAALKDALGGTISVDSIISAEETTISSAIAKVGFWRRKTQYIKQTAVKLRDEFDSDVPKTVDDLCSLPGVGPKMAFLALHSAWDLNVGIGVDVHVHRITNRLGWHKPATKNPEETRLNLQSWLPKEYHREINHLLVGFGQTICIPVNPKCEQCSLSAAGLCPSAKVKSSTGKKRKAKALPELEASSSNGEGK
ncbi:DNA glycosylase [Rickenella mellea]|uniref:Endonuclease III homolog n=1 Tax=Rickenella mellea TaxID=50990 RepID=A0A4Y7PTN4_9AGAM|nr:DNA glycosylase [Rickenella mellea]